MHAKRFCFDAHCRYTLPGSIKQVNVWKNLTEEKKRSTISLINACSLISAYVINSNLKNDHSV